MGKTDIRYVVDKENKIVVCVLENCTNIPVIRLKKYLGRTFKLKNADKYTIHESYRGIAHCAPDDTFDVETGKQLALKRAKMKRAKAINNAINRFILDIDNIKSNTLECAMTNMS